MNFMNYILLMNKTHFCVKCLKLSLLDKVKILIRRLNYEVKMEK